MRLPKANERVNTILGSGKCTGNYDSTPKDWNTNKLWFYETDIKE